MDDDAPEPGEREPDDLALKEDREDAALTPQRREREDDPRQRAWAWR